MSLHVSIGGMKMRGWSAFFRIIPLTYRALRAARRAEGCVHADIFRRGRRYFAFSCWSDEAAMKAYAHSGVHAQLMREQAGGMVSFKNHSFTRETIPTRDEAEKMWQEAQKGA